MNTGEAVEILRPLFREYDAATDMETRIALGERLDNVAMQLSGKQIEQVIRILGIGSSR